MSTSTILGIVLLLYAIIVLFTGRISNTEGPGSRWTSITRSENPIQYWLAVIISLTAAALFLFKIIQF